jgi:hypothetical protein
MDRLRMTSFVIWWYSDLHFLVFDLSGSGLMPTTYPSFSSSSEGRAQARTYWANRLARPEELIAQDLARASWDTATNTTQRHVAGVIFDAISGSAAHANFHLKTRRSIHRRLPLRGWDRAFKILVRNEFLPHLTGFSGACLTAAIGAGAPVDRLARFPQLEMFFDLSSKLYSPSLSERRHPENTDEQPFASHHDREMNGQVSAKNTFRPYCLSSMADVMVLWRTPESIPSFWSAAPPHLLEQTLLIAAPATAYVLMLIWLRSITRTPLLLNKSMRIETDLPSLSAWLLSDVGEVADDPAQNIRDPLIDRILDCAVALTIERLGLSSWLDIRMDAKSVPSEGLSPDIVSSSLQSRLPARMRDILARVNRINAEPSDRAKVDPQGWRRALAEAERRSIEWIPGPVRAPFDRSPLVVDPFFPLWSSITARLISDKENQADWARSRAEALLEKIDLWPVTVEVSSPSGLPTISLEKGIILKWIRALAELVSPEDYVRLGPKFCIRAREWGEHSVIRDWAKQVGFFVEKIRSSGRPMSARSADLEPGLVHVPDGSNGLRSIADQSSAISDRQILTMHLAVLDLDLQVPVTQPTRVSPGRRM